jgi:regulator of RNase E activity RraA
MSLNSATRDKLKTVATATIATALFKRGLRTQMIQGALPLRKGKPTMVGEAFTLRYMPAREDRNPISVFQSRAHPQRKAVEDCPAGAVMVIDSRKDARAASAGSILITRLQVRGVAGIVTDGGFRDASEIAVLDIPSFHVRPSAPTNLTLHEAIEINGPIGCGDAPVFPGDVIVWMEAGFIGAWGEWHSSTNGLDKSVEAKRQVVDALLDALPETRSVQLRYPGDIEALTAHVTPRAQCKTARIRTRPSRSRP